MLKVVCIIYKYSPTIRKYHEAYICRLLGQVRRCISIPFEFHVITNVDYPEEMNESFTFHKKTYEELSDGWAKLEMLEMFDGPCLYLDLATVLQKNIDDLLTTDADIRVVNEYWNEGGVNTSMMYWNRDKYQFDGAAEDFKLSYTNFNDFVADQLNHDFFPRGYIYSRAYGYDELENGLIGDVKNGITDTFISYKPYNNKSLHVCLHNGLKKFVTFEQLKEMREYWEPIPYYDD
jgi:hypothetical protein